MNRSLWYCGNIVVATFLCLNISFLSATGAPINTSGLNIAEEKLKAFSFKDVPFKNSLSVNNRTITCADTSQGSHYPTPMFTCNEIRVDNEKLFHGYLIDGRRSKQQCASGCPCGSNIGHPMDIRALCSAMLQANDIHESLIAAYVVKPSCDGDQKPAKRVKFYLNEESNPVWEDLVATNGYINTLQCLTERKHSKT